jgi:N-acetylmuramoyl-L-alanine amidase
MHVLRIVLPDGTRAIDLPRIEGPADASRPLVVIDAGHGGHDPARAAGHLAREAVDAGPCAGLARCAAGRRRVRVALTRERPLPRARRAFGDRAAAPCRPVHLDPCRSASAADAGGATVYTLSDRGSERSDALARRENRADSVNGVALAGRSDAVSSILVDLSRRAQPGSVWPSFA